MPPPPPSHQQMGQRRRRRMPKVASKSFTEQVAEEQAKKEQAQARVLNSVRATVHSVETARPFTPMDSSRGLFGASRGLQSRSSSASSSSGGRRAMPRPPSAFPIGRKQFLENLPDTELLERPTTGVKLRRKQLSASSRVQPQPPPADSRRRTMSTSGDTRPTSRRGLSSGRHSARAQRATSTSISPHDELSSSSEPTTTQSQTQTQTQTQTQPKTLMQAAIANERRRSSSSCNLTIVTSVESHDGEAAAPTGQDQDPSTIMHDEREEREEPLSKQKRVHGETHVRSGRQMPPRPPARKSNLSARSRSALESESAVRRALSADQRRLASADVKERDRWEVFHPLLLQLSVDENPKVLQGVVCQIERELQENGPFHTGQRNSEVLRSLVRLTDMTDCRLLARLSRVILMITRKTVKSVCKLIFKQSRTAANDVILREEKIPELLVAVMESCNINEHTEALVYCCGALKNLSTSPDVQAFLLEKNILTTMGAQLSAVFKKVEATDTASNTTARMDQSQDDGGDHADQASPRGRERPLDRVGSARGLSTHAVHFIVQMTAALRNLASAPENIHAFCDAEIIPSLCRLMGCFLKEKDIVFNVVRILSKVSAEGEEGAAAVCECTDIVVHLAEALQVYRTKKAVCIRVLYILGNITIDSAEMRHQLFKASDSGELLLASLAWRGRDLVDSLSVSEGDEDDVDDALFTEDSEEVDGKRKQLQKSSSDRANGTAAASTKRSKKEELAAAELEDLVIKLVRVIANLCISEDLAATLCAQTRLSLLLDILRCGSVATGHDDLLMNLVGCINNISFYQVDENYILQNKIDYSRALIPYLLTKNMELFVEVARVFGNFSQSQEVRDLLVESRAVEVLCLLLPNESHEVVYSVCGILINLLGDPNHRQVLANDDYAGVYYLIDIMWRCGRDGGDWQTAGLACKALWNYTEQLATQNEHEELMSADALDYLLEVLSDLTAEDASPQEEAALAMYAAEFLPVAQHMLAHVEECFHATSSAAIDSDEDADSHEDSPPPQHQQQDPSPLVPL